MVTHRRTLVVAATAVVALWILGCSHAMRAHSNETTADVTLLRGSMADAFMAQEVYYSIPQNKYTYASDVSRLTQYRPRPGTILTILEGTAEGWSGIVQDASGNGCVMYVGKVSKIPRTPRGTVATKKTVAEDRNIACDVP